MSAIMNSLRPSLRSVAAGGYGRTFTTSSPRAVSKMILTGRLGAEPELQATSTGQEIVRYSVGCSHGRQADRRTSWFRVASFQTEGNQRDFLLGLQKGSLVYLEADASLRTYEDAEGKRQSNLNLVQRNIEVLKRPFNPDAAPSSESPSE